MSNKMVIDCGGKLVTMEELGSVEIPEATATYHPVPHQELAEMIKQTGTELLRVPLKSENYALSKDGQRMFGLQVYGENGKCPICKGMGTLAEPLAAGLTSETCLTCQGTGWAPPEFGLGVAFRNSYDKSISVGVALGFNVFICNNLAISGEIRILRKHTKNVWEDLDQVLVHTLFRKRPQMEEQFMFDVNKLKNREMPLHEGWRFMGLCHGFKILTATQLGIAFRAWGATIDHQNRMANAWQLYNSCTQALKSSPPHRIMEAHKNLHGLMLTEY